MSNVTEAFLVLENCEVSEQTEHRSLTREDIATRLRQVATGVESGIINNLHLTMLHSKTASRQVNLDIFNMDSSGHFGSYQDFLMGSQEDVENLITAYGVYGSAGFTMGGNNLTVNHDILNDAGFTEEDIIPIATLFFKQGEE